MVLTSDPTFPLFPIVSILTCIVTLIPLSWHLQQWNAGTCLFMFWSSLVCFVSFVNSLVWHGNVRNVAPVWCDISAQIIIAANAGIAAATVCISRRLYRITALKGGYATESERRKALGKDLSISIGIPLLVCILHLIVQPYRFDIIEDIGCYPSTYNSLLAYVLYYMWSIAMGLISLVYGCLALQMYHRRRAEISRLMVIGKESHSSTPSKSSHAESFATLTVSRYFRLMLLAAVHVICTIPIGIYSILISAIQMPDGSAQPKRNWHVVRVILGVEWRGDQVMYGCTEINRWMPVFCGIIFFALFGFASEARTRYQRWWNWLLRKVRREHVLSPRERWRPSLRGLSWSRDSKATDTESTIIGSDYDLTGKRLLPFSRNASFYSTYKAPLDPKSPSSPDTMIPCSSSMENVHLYPPSIASSPTFASPSPSSAFTPIPLNQKESEAHNDATDIVYYIDPVHGLMTQRDLEAAYRPNSPTIAL